MIGSSSDCERGRTDGSMDFFSSLMMLPYCVSHVLIHFLHWNGCIQRICCTAVCCHSLVFRNSVSADRSGMAASRLIVAAVACVVLLRLAAESRTSHCNGSVRRGNGALAAVFFGFWQL